MNKKRAFIDKILLGFLLIVLSVVLIGTVADELKVRNKYTSLKQVLQAAVLSSSKYYTYEENDINKSESIALGIIAQVPLGNEIKDDIIFTWDFDSTPNNVIATLPTYTEDLFWFRFLDLNSYALDDIKAKANIVKLPLGELPIVDAVSDFMPFAINSCGQEGNVTTPGDSLSFIYKAYAQYDSTDGIGFYGLDSDPIDGENQSEFAHFKNVIDKFYNGESSDFNRTDTQQYLVNSIYDETATTNPINNDAGQLSSSLEVKKFSDSFPMSIALLDCNSTKDNIIVSNIIPVSMTNVYCGYKLTSDTNIDKAFTEQNSDVFDSSITWINWTENNDCSSSGLFRIDIDISIPTVDTVILTD